jgi:hypothetical protein
MEVKKLENLKNSSKENIPHMSDEFRKNLQWLRENRNKLSKYENNWIAVYDQQIVGFSSNPYELEKKVASEALDINKVVFHYLVNSNCIF